MLIVETIRKIRLWIHRDGKSIPYLGPILSAVPALLFALGEGGMTPVWVLFVYLAVQVFENNLICPLIMSRSMKLHSVAVIFSMLICVTAFGVLGVLVAAPLVAIVNIVHDEIYRKHFLPMVTDADLDRMAQNALRETPSVSK
ncbi:MAG: AI-2E family transporter [Desulfobacterales bacterium]